MVTFPEPVSRTDVFSNFCFSLSLVALKTCRVLVLICSSILLASFVERADVILCVVDSASLAFCISLVSSLRNLVNASSVTLRAPLVELAVEFVDL